MPYRKRAEEALATWRDAARRMEELDADSPAWQDAYAEAELAKAYYQQAIDDARAAHLPEPPAFNLAAAGQARGQRRVAFGRSSRSAIAD